MERKKVLLKLCLVLMILMIGFRYAYKIYPPDLNNKDIKDFRKTCTTEYEFINKVKFKCREGGLDILFYTKDVTDNVATQILSVTQDFITTQKFKDYLSEKYRKRYQNLTMFYSEDYTPPVVIKIYEGKNLVPSYEYIAASPYKDWN